MEAKRTNKHIRWITFLGTFTTKHVQRKDDLPVPAAVYITSSQYIDLFLVSSGKRALEARARVFIYPLIKFVVG